MAQFRKKPVVIEAFQWTGGPDQIEDPLWVCAAIARGEVSFSDVGTPNVTLDIHTLEGTMHPRHLSWGTKSDNERDKKRHGTTGKGEPRYKINAQQAAEILALKGRMSAVPIAESYGISPANVRMIWSGKTWKG